MAEVSFAVSTIGLIIPFILVDPVASGADPVPISNALSANCTWIAANGRQRPLTLQTPVSAVFVYSLSSFDSRSPHTEEGWLRVSFDTNQYFTSSFFVNCFQHF